MRFLSLKFSGFWVPKARRSYPGFIDPFKEIKREAEAMEANEVTFIFLRTTNLSNSINSKPCECEHFLKKLIISRQNYFYWAKT